MAEPSPNITTTDVATQSVTIVDSSRNEVALIYTSGNGLKFGLLNDTAPISFGYNAGLTSQGADSIAIGNGAGQTSQKFNTTSIGAYAGQIAQGRDCVAIGILSGQTSQGDYSVAIGDSAGITSQGTSCVSIGTTAGASNQSDYAIAIGNVAGQTSQQEYAIAIGDGAGRVSQGDNSVCIGVGAGRFNQSQNAVCVGPYAGFTGQGEGCVAIGQNAGYSNQGNYAIAIGTGAGNIGQPASSIIINATVGTINGATGNAFYVAPIRSYASGDFGATGTLLYNTTTNEITYNTAKTFVIDHPVDKEKYLVHSCLEGPEGGIYYRGKSCIEEQFKSVEVKLPDYIKNFGFDFTINITPILTSSNGVRSLCCTEVENGSFTVHGEPGPFYWTVFGKRMNVEAEPLKSEVTVVGDGPYKYLC